MSALIVQNVTQCPQVSVMLIIPPLFMLKALCDIVVSVVFYCVNTNTFSGKPHWKLTGRGREGGGRGVNSNSLRSLTLSHALGDSNNSSTSQERVFPLFH